MSMVVSRRDKYATPEMVAAVCIDEECELSGGYAHVGPCEPCNCGDEHAIEECPVIGRKRDARQT